ncbi:MAG: hypothetical protein ACYC1C_06030 [Chloroflexota bacterium]
MAMADALRFAQASSEIKDLATSQVWTDGWYRSPDGYPSEVFRYSLCPFDIKRPDGNVGICMAFEFFQGIAFYVLFDAPMAIANELLLPI